MLTSTIKRPKLFLMFNVTSIIFLICACRYSVWIDAPSAKSSETTWTPAYWITFNSVISDDLYIKLSTNDDDDDDFTSKFTPPAMHDNVSSRQSKALESICWTVSEAVKRQHDDANTYTFACHYLSIARLSIFGALCLSVITLAFLMMVLNPELIAAASLRNAARIAIPILSFLAAGLLILALICYTSLGTSLNDFIGVPHSVEWNFSTGIFVTCFACGFLLLLAMYSTGYKVTHEEEDEDLVTP